MSELKAAAERLSYRQRCEAECTRDVIFLFQVRDVNWIEAPTGYEWDSGTMRKSPDNDDEDDPQELTDEDMIERSSAIESWRTESVWLTRAEGEAWGRAKDYRFAKGWRVYGVPAEGELAALIKTT
jgi:hypothetical protein